ncbi:MAG: hypothetical protein D4R97_06360 [Bacteroidetes bacterium]|nr:MAG: hypothetical protein D4R97_06360 [Bacteroidota bacterium]
MSARKLIYLFCFFLLISCGHNPKVRGVYRCYWGEKEGFKIWIVDGYKVRQKVYKEFLYGGNEQRYLFNPKGEIWIDHAVSCEEFELTLAHELNERALMAKFGWTYEKSHDSSLMLELRMRKNYDSICRAHEASLHKVSPKDATNVEEIPGIPDSVVISGIYRMPLGIRDGISIWIVDGYKVRANIFPDFGLSGNDMAYHYIPQKEIWIDGQISSEETEFSIKTELLERRLMANGTSYGKAYDSAINLNVRLRQDMQTLINAHPPLIIPPVLVRDTGVKE